MKKLLTLLFTLFAFCASAQKVQPIQIQTIDTTTYVVDYIPLATAQANVNAKIKQVDAQLAQVDAEIAKLVKRRDELITQKAALELVQKQLAQADTTPPPPVQQSAAPQSEPPKTKKPKAKN